MPSKVAIFKYRNKVKGSVVPVHATKAYRKVEVLFCLFVSLAHTHVDERSASCCGCFTPGDRALLHTFSGGWLGLKAHLNILE